MKRLTLLILSLIVILTPCCAHAEPALATTEQPPFDINAKSALLLEPTTGRVILEKDADTPFPVASIVKAMSLLLICDALEKGRIAETDMVTISKNAASQPGSEVFLDANVKYPVSDLLKSVVIASANDATVALAEHVYGSENEFVSHMNAKARELGMTKTTYINCTGLPAEGQGMSARDIAKVAAALVDRPAYRQYATQWLDTLKHPSGRITDLVNTNRLVRFYDGADGVKTGSTNEAGFCVAASATRDGMRLMAIVLGSSTSNARFNTARQMLDYGFDHYHMPLVAKAGDSLLSGVEVKGFGNNSVDIVSSGDLRVLVKKGEEERLRVEVEVEAPLAAPLYHDKPVGEIVVYIGNTEAARLPAYPATDVKLPGLLENVRTIFGKWMLYN